MGPNPSRARCCCSTREERSSFLKMGQNERVKASLGVLGTLWANLKPNRLG